MNENTETLANRNNTKGCLISMLVLALVIGQVLSGLFAKKQNMAL